MRESNRVGRTAVAALFTFVAVGCTAMGPESSNAMTTLPSTSASASASPSSTPDITVTHAERPPLGWAKEFTISVPSWGPVAYGQGAVWVIDADGGRMDGKKPAGRLYQIDPSKGSVLDEILHVTGGCPTVGESAIWLCTQLDNLIAPDSLTRVDLASHQVSSIRTDPSSDAEPEGVTIAYGRVWVANNFAGTIVEIDPRTDEVERTIDVGDGIRGLPATDGASVWFGRTETGEIVRIDAATGKLESSLLLPTIGVEGLLAAQGHLYATTPGHIYEIDVSRVGEESVTRDLLLSPATGGAALGMRAAFGSLWAIRANPGELLRIDLETLEVEGRMRLAGVDADAPIPDDFAIRHGAVWVRTPGRLVELRPN